MKHVQVKPELTTVSKTDNAVESLARLNYHAECEAGINEQINIEMNISYVYSALHAFFDRYNPKQHVKEDIGRVVDSL